MRGFSVQAWECQSRYSYSAGTGCQNITVGFLAVPWDSRANVTWMVWTEGGRQTVAEDNIGPYYTLTRRIDYKRLETCLGNKKGGQHYLIMTFRQLYVIYWRTRLSR